MMNRVLQVFMGICFSLLAGCTLSPVYNHVFDFPNIWNRPKTPPPPPQPRVPPDTIVSQTVPVSDFNNIVVTGRQVNVNIVGRTLDTSVSMRGPTYQVGACKTFVEANTLYINCPSPSTDLNTNMPVDYTVHTANDISNLTFNAYGNLSANNIGYSGMVLNVGGHSTVNLTGNLLIQRINASGQSTINAYWLGNRDLRIVARDFARVTVAGVALTLDATATNHAVINARYLRTDDAYVHTTDRATAYIYIRRMQSTWSTQQSTVFYYRDPHFGTPFLANSGADLRMNGLSLYDNERSY